MRKAFSLLEIIFAVVILSIIATVAIPKLFSTVDFSKKVKIKNDVLLIREGINKIKTKALLQAQTNFLDTLEENDELLFSKVLTFPIKASITKKTGSWSKISEDTYKVFIDNNNSLEFYYDNTNYTFDCNHQNNLCEEFSQ